MWACEGGWISRAELTSCRLDRERAVLSEVEPSIGHASLMNATLWWILLGSSSATSGALSWEGLKALV